MANRRNRYKEMERYMGLTLGGDLLLFIAFLVASGYGIIWLKVILSILAIILSGLCLTYLYFTKELLRDRSLWMSASAAAIVICILFSLLLNFPSPNPYKQNTSQNNGSYSDTTPDTENAGT